MQKDELDNLKTQLAKNPGPVDIQDATFGVLERLDNIEPDRISNELGDILANMSECRFEALKNCERFFALVAVVHNNLNRIK